MKLKLNLFGANRRLKVRAEAEKVIRDIDALSAMRDQEGASRLLGEYQIVRRKMLTAGVQERDVRTYDKRSRLGYDIMFDPGSLWRAA